MNNVYYLIVIHEQPRARRRRANRERILDAALEIASRDGLDSLSVKKVADAADYTPGALYRYFPSKGALMAAVATHVISGLGSTLSKVEGSGLSRVRAQVDAYVRFSRDEPHRFALITNMFAESRILLPGEEDAAKVGVAMHAALMPVATSLHDATAQGELDAGEPAQRVLALFAALQGALQMRKQERVMPQLLDAEQLAQTLTETLLRGWGAEQ